MENYISASIDTSVIYSIFNKSFLLDNKILFKRGLHEDILFMYKVYLFSKKSLFINNNFYVKEKLSSLPYRSNMLWYSFM